jgi:hypothetical protein
LTEAPGYPAETKLSAINVSLGPALDVVTGVAEFDQTLIYLAEIASGLIRFCELIGGYLYLANQV